MQHWPVFNTALTVAFLWVAGGGVVGHRAAAPQGTSETVHATIGQGLLQGSIESSGVRSFKGVPFAAPPVGQLRWKAPQLPSRWAGRRNATEFGSRCMQGPGPGGTEFRSSTANEDCLYLNIWTAAKSPRERLPVLVYFHGGGFGLGDGSERRHDGEEIAREGVVVVTTNYRLGIFGALAHPELSAESPYGASGNYGLLDQAAALRWVHQNITAFGGDPTRITIAGNSSGAMAVSAHLASPLSKGFVKAAIGSSGAMTNPMPPLLVPLAEAESAGLQLTTAVGARSIAELRALSAADLLERRKGTGMLRLPPVIDGYFLPKSVKDVFRAGEQARVPVMIGWAFEEQPARAVFGNSPPSAERFSVALKELFRDRASEALELYRADTPEAILRAAADLASDRFINYAMWKWADLHLRTASKPVYRYINIHPAPHKTDAPAGPRRAAGHGDDIDYAMGNLRRHPSYQWTAEDERVADLLQAAYVNFVKRGDPNGAGVPKWPSANALGHSKVLYVQVQPTVMTDPHRDRYLFLDSVYGMR